MSYKQAIHDIMSNDVNVTSLVSTRITPEFARQDETKPFIVYSVTDINQVQTKDNANSVDLVSFIVMCFSTTSLQVETLAGYCRNALSRYSGTIGSETVNTVIYEGESNDYIEDERVHMITQNYVMRINN